MKASVFTFVRDPLTRFVSGYTETETRNDALTFKSPFPMGSHQRALDFATSVFAGKFVNGHINRQVQFLLHHLKECPLNFDFVGRIETYNQDVQRLGEKVGCDPSTFGFDHGVGQHLSSKDPFNTTRAMRAVLQSRRSLMVELCRFYLLDYVLFNYSLPLVCSDG